MTSILNRILGKKTLEEKESARIKFIQELIAMQARKQALQPSDHARNTAEDFYVDSVVVFKKDGTVLTSTNGHDEKDFNAAVKNSSLFEYISSEYPDAKMVLVKDKDQYNFICSDGEKLASFKAPGELCSLEAKKIVERLNAGIEQKNNGVELKSNDKAKQPE